EPFTVDGIAGKASADLIVNTAHSDLFQRKVDLVDEGGVGRQIVAAQEQHPHRWHDELRSAVHAAPRRIESRSKFCCDGIYVVGEFSSCGARPEPFHVALCEVACELACRRFKFFAADSERLCNIAEQLLPGFGRIVGAAIERFLIRREEYIEWPSAVQ